MGFGKQARMIGGSISRVKAIPGEAEKAKQALIDTTKSLAGEVMTQAEIIKKFIEESLVGNLLKQYIEAAAIARDNPMAATTDFAKAESIIKRFGGDLGQKIDFNSLRSGLEPGITGGDTRLGASAAAEGEGGARGTATVGMTRAVSAFTRHLESLSKTMETFDGVTKTRIETERVAVEQQKRHQAEADSIWSRVKQQFQAGNGSGLDSALDSKKETEKAGKSALLMRARGGISM